MRTLAAGPAAAVGMLPDRSLLVGAGGALWVVSSADGATRPVALDYGAAKRRLQDVRAIACNPAGTCAIADLANNRVWAWEQTGTRPGAVTASLKPLAGSGTAFYPIGDGGLAASAQLDAPRGVAWLPDGSLALSDTGHGRVRLVAADGRIVTLAGTGLAGAPGDAGPAGKAVLLAPGPLAAGPDGSLFVVETGAPRVRRINPDRQIETLATEPVAALAVTPGGVVVAAVGREIRTVGAGDGQAVARDLHGPAGLAVAADGTLAVADTDRVVLLEP